MATTTMGGSSTTRTTTTRNSISNRNLYWGIAIAALLILGILFTTMRTQDIETAPSGLMNAPVDVPAVPATPMIPNPNDATINQVPQDNDAGGIPQNGTSGTGPDAPTETRPEY